MIITSEDQLRALYGFPSGRATLKVMTKLDEHSSYFISKSPFLTLGTVNNHGHMDVSPRGGSVGFVHVINDSQILIPDSKGNNRLDSLVNIIENKCVGLLFLIPGIEETLRINGTACISTNIDHLNVFATEKSSTKTCILVDVNEVFLHCAKALMRSKLWDMHSQIPRTDFPTMGQMLKDQLKSTDPAESYEDMVKRYLPDL